MYDTYARIFERCGLTFRAVEADTGLIGGSLSHEFQVLAASGEDAIVSCDRCSYAANVDKAETRPLPSVSAAGGALERVTTPGRRTVEEVSAFLGLPAERFVKTLLFQTAAGAAVAALVRGDHEVSAVKVKTALGGTPVALADEATVERVTGAPVGFAGPVGLRVRILADASLRGTRGAVSGANRADEHVLNVDLERDVAGAVYADLRQARAGDACPRCEGGRLVEHRGIEVGQVFYNGTKYTEPMGATFLDADGVQRPIEMGCYGIGITRTVAAAVEQHHDEAGIVWPVPLAPYGAVVVPVSMADAGLRETAERIAGELEGAGIDALLDDRDERPGVKFKDADLIGLPVRVTVGPRAYARGNVELKRRSEAQPSEVSVAEAARKAAAMVGER
jgi:prolyl-tRNA synthetase